MGLLDGLSKGLAIAAVETASAVVTKNKILKSCLMSEEVEGIPSFTYEGNIYNKARYIDLRVQSIRELAKRYVREGLEDYRRKSEKRGLSEIEAADMEAYSIVWADKRYE